MGPATLAQVLAPLTKLSDPRLIVGLQTSDDAAVFRLSADQAIVQTVDFFPPVVDDPFSYGAIAAANSMSDVYAMGGEVVFALNVAAFPASLDPAILSRIFEGGAAKVAEAGAVIAGGHTVTDDEPKYGLCVTGLIHPDRVWTKAGAKPGHVVFLTKPIGTGLITTALRNQALASDHYLAALDSMTTLNRLAAETARSVPPSACTDITGFGLLGHGFEIAEKSGVKLLLDATAIPLLPGALDYAAAGHQAGGLGRNRDYYGSRGVLVSDAIHPDLAAVLYDPQTSGGLIFTVAPDRAEQFAGSFAHRGLSLWSIGHVAAGHGVEVTG